jgi:hypothetical protein
MEWFFKRDGWEGLFDGVWESLGFSRLEFNDDS